MATGIDLTVYCIFADGRVFIFALFFAQQSAVSYVIVFSELKRFSHEFSYISSPITQKPWENTDI